MKIIQGVHFTYYDVDDTIVLWKTMTPENEHEFVAFSNPDDSHDIWMLKPNWKVINDIKETKNHGGTVVVWSQGGWDWCIEVVKVLKLEEYVDVIMTKPTRYVDDLPCEKWMGTWRQV